MAALPRVLKVGNVEYKVRLDRDSSLEEENEGGLCDPTKLEIHILSSCPHQRQVTFLSHELTHALLSESGLDSLYSNEKVVEALSITLLQFIRENDLKWAK